MRQSARSRIQQRLDLAQRLTYWLIVKEQDDRVEVFTTGTGEERLPVFSFEEEAALFLRLEELSEEVWSTRATTARKLASMLMESCKSIGQVAFDPLPRALGRVTSDPASVERESFVERLTGIG